MPKMRYDTKASFYAVRLHPRAHTMLKQLKNINGVDKILWYKMDEHVKFAANTTTRTHAMRTVFCKMRKCTRNKPSCGMFIGWVVMSCNQIRKHDVPTLISQFRNRSCSIRWESGRSFLTTQVWTLLPACPGPKEPQAWAEQDMVDCGPGGFWAIFSFYICFSSPQS